MSEKKPLSRWHDFVDVFLQYRQAQVAAWGTVDDLLLARYLARTTSPVETAHVEQQMRACPELQQAVEVLQSLTTSPSEPTALSHPADVPAPVTPSSVWERGKSGFWSVAEPLKVWLDQQQDRLASSGLNHCLFSPARTVSHLMSEGEEEVRQQVWVVPLPELAGMNQALLLTIRVTWREAGWQCQLEPRTQSGADVPADFWNETWVELVPLKGQPGGTADSLQSLFETPIQLGGGAWRLLLKYQDEVIELPLELGLDS